MSLIMRGFVFRAGEVVRSFSNYDPTQSETYEVNMPVEPGDVVYVIDDTLAMHEFTLIAQPTIEGRFSEAEVRALTPARFEVPVTGSVPEGAQLFWAIVGRKDQGRLEVRTPGETLAAALKARVKGAQAAQEGSQR